MKVGVLVDNENRQKRKQRLSDSDTGKSIYTVQHVDAIGVRYTPNQRHIQLYMQKQRHIETEPDTQRNRARYRCTQNQRQIHAQTETDTCRNRDKYMQKQTQIHAETKTDTVCNAHK